eukprot:141176-Prymnesium_polylepis.1
MSPAGACRAACTASSARRAGGGAGSLQAQAAGTLIALGLVLLGGGVGGVGGRFDAAPLRRLGSGVARRRRAHAAEEPPDAPLARGGVGGAVLVEQYSLSSVLKRLKEERRLMPVEPAKSSRGEEPAARVARGVPPRVPRLGADRERREAGDWAAVTQHVDEAVEAREPLAVGRAGREELREVARGKEGRLRAVEQADVGEGLEERGGLEQGRWWWHVGHHRPRLDFTV